MKNVKHLGRRGLALLLVLMMCLGLLNLTAFAAESKVDKWYGGTDTNYSGTGTSTDPYVIDSAKKLAGLGSHSGISDSSKYYRLDVDIDLNGEDYEWAPITPFHAHFMGNGHTISNMKITSGTKIGLFGVVYGKISDLKLKDSSVTTTDTTGVAKYSQAGGFVGEVSGTAPVLCNLHLINSTVTASGAFVGGIAGYASPSGTYGGTVRICNCSISGGTSQEEKSIIKSTGSYGAGGILGGTAESSNDIYIEECWSTGSEITANVLGAGGIYGNHLTTAGKSVGTKVYISNCYNASSVTTSATYAGTTGGAGGILGNINNGYSVVENCYNVGTIKAGTNVSAGGIIGNNTGTKINYSVNAGSITGTSKNAISNGGTLTYSYWLNTSCTSGPTTGTNKKVTSIENDVVAKNLFPGQTSNTLKCDSTSVWVSGGGEYGLPTLSLCQGSTHGCSCGCDCSGNMNLNPDEEEEEPTDEPKAEDLTVTKTLDGDVTEFHPGQTATWTVTIENTTGHDRYVDVSEVERDGLTLAYPDGDPVDNPVLIEAGRELSLTATYNIPSNYFRDANAEVTFKNSVTVKNLGPDPENPPEEDIEISGESDREIQITLPGKPSHEELDSDHPGGLIGILPYGPDKRHERQQPPRG